MRGKHTSDDLAKSIYRFKDANPATARIFSISESTLRGILKRRIGQKKVKLRPKSVLTRRIKRQLLGRLHRNSKLRLSDLPAYSQTTCLQCHGTPFFEKSRNSKSNAQRDRRVNWCGRHLFSTSQKVFSATIN